MDRNMIIAVAFDRLIYQNDSCRIFHCHNAEVFQRVKSIMEEEESYRLVQECCVNDSNFYLIYFLA